MLRILILIFAIATSALLHAQTMTGDRCPYKGVQLTDNRVIKEAQDFTITTTDGITRNLYNTLDSGKTVFVDLFYTTCSWCQYYAPVIEDIYQNHGAGEGDIVFWGISNNLNDPDDVIDQYKINYNISNPCAGPDGGGTTAHTIVISGQNFLGWPTYCVICPDRTLFFDPCYPPTVSGFDPYFTQCAETIGIDDPKHGYAGFSIRSIFPNPANNEVSIEINSKNQIPLSIEFYNLLGIKVMSSSFEIFSGTRSMSISTGELPDGVYFVKAIQPGQVPETRKVQISH